MNIKKLVKKYYVFKTLKVNNYTINNNIDYDYLIKNMRNQIVSYVISDNVLNLLTY